MSLDPRALPPQARAFLIERHLATLTTLRADGSPHVVAVGFTWDEQAGLARVITRAATRKAAHASLGGRAVLAQVDGPRWLALEGPVTVSAEPARVAEAVRRYAVRYREPRVSPTRVVVEIAVDRILGSSRLGTTPEPGSHGDQPAAS